MKNLRKIIALLVCLVLALTVVGCGKEKTNNDELQNDIDKVQSQIDDTAKENSQNKVGKYVTPDESAFTFEEVTDGVAITGYSGTDKAVIIPDTLGGKNVVEIRSGSFTTAGILGVKLPKTLTVVTEKAFYYCTTLLEVYLGENTTTIGSQVFEGCIALENVKMNNGLKEIGVQAFGYCSLLKSIELSSTIEKIGTGAFCLSGIENITIPSSVELIDESAFATCSSLEKVKINDGVKSIGSEAFAGCEKLKDVEIPASVETIGSRAFSQSQNVVINAPSGSIAETYATENDITFKAS